MLREIFAETLTLTGNEVNLRFYVDVRQMKKEAIQISSQRLKNIALKIARQYLGLNGGPIKIGVQNTGNVASAIAQLQGEGPISSEVFDSIMTEIEQRLQVRYATIAKDPIFLPNGKIVKRKLKITIKNTHRSGTKNVSKYMENLPKLDEIINSQAIFEEFWLWLPSSFLRSYLDFFKDATFFRRTSYRTLYEMKNRAKEIGMKYLGFGNREILCTGLQVYANVSIALDSNTVDQSIFDQALVEVKEKLNVVYVQFCEFLAGNNREFKHLL